MCKQIQHMNISVAEAVWFLIVVWGLLNSVGKQTDPDAGHYRLTSQQNVALYLGKYKVWNLH